MNLTDKSFRNSNARECHLSLQVECDGLSYCIVDMMRNQLVALRKYSFPECDRTDELVSRVAGAFSDNETLDLPFRSTYVIYLTQHSTLVPDAYFDAAHAGRYLLHNHPALYDHAPHFNHIAPLKTWNLFSIPSSLESVITSQFSNAVLVHQATPFLTLMFQNRHAARQPLVAAGLNQGFFDVAVYHQDKLQLYNSFQYGNEKDLLYFVLFVTRSLKLEPESVSLRLSGELSTKLIYYETLKSRFGDTGYLKAPAGLSLAPALQSFTPHKYLNLISLHCCVSSEENTEEEKSL